MEKPKHYSTPKTKLYDTLKRNISVAVANLTMKIDKTEQDCYLKLTDLKEVTQTSLSPQVAKENWITVSILLDNALELFSSDLYEQCHEQRKERKKVSEE